MSWPNISTWPSGGSDQAEEHANGCGLACTIGSKEAKDITAMNLQTQTTNGHTFSIAFREILQPDNDLAGTFPGRSFPRQHKGCFYHKNVFLSIHPKMESLFIIQLRERKCYNDMP